jgi:hypothetical protein
MEFNKKMYDFSLHPNNLEYLSKLEEFTRMMFNYLNGKVNIINKTAELQIDYIINEDKILATNIQPNIVNIFLYKILWEYADCSYLDFFQMKIIYLLTHELSHCDQIVDNELYINNIEYRNKIESEADYNATQFLLSHKEEMINLFKLDIAFEFIQIISDDNKYCGDFIKYNRHDLFSYYSNILTEKIGGNELSFSNILYAYGNMNLCMNNESIFNIQKNFKLNPDTYTFINIISYMYSPCTYYCKINVSESDNDTIIINITSHIIKIEPIIFI